LQDYDGPAELIVLDDAGELLPGESEPIPGRVVRILSTADRYPDLPSKFNKLSSISSGELLAVWEDDDIYLPWHLHTIATTHLDAPHAGLLAPRKAFSTYGQPYGQVIIEEVSGRFHGAWAYVAAAFRSTGGYVKTPHLTFDQETGGRMSQQTGKYEYETPSYVYRCNHNQYRGSQVSGTGYLGHYDSLRALPAGRDLVIEPAIDDWTRRILEQLT
jgi:hypothetical protein